MRVYEEQGFDSFWREYPKKRSKGDAYKAWRATKGVRPPIEKMLKAIAVLRATDDWRKDGGQYIPYPGTWLRAWGWEDVPEVEMAGVVNGKMWWETVSGVEAKANELGIPPWGERVNGEFLNESWQQWAKRVRALAETPSNSNVVPLKKIA